MDLIKEALTEVLGNSVRLRSSRSVGGGCINQCFQIITNRENYFIKINEAPYLDMFEKEFQGLKAMNEFFPLTIPIPLGYGSVGNHSYLLMEFIESGPPDADYWEQLGEGLALGHQQTNHQFGWHVDNYIGRLPQSNTWRDRWITFFIEDRLKPQIRFSVDSGLLPDQVHKKFKELYQRMDQLIPAEPPALLHGDLWSGNLMVGPRGEPCLVDPAIYYGHREIELAFTTLFGTFNKIFYEAYNHQYPLTPGYQKRFDLYNLYPLMVHLNLFGRGYLGSIKSALDRYI